MKAYAAQPVIHDGYRSPDSRSPDSRSPDSPLLRLLLIVSCTASVFTTLLCIPVRAEISCTVTITGAPDELAEILHRSSRLQTRKQQYRTQSALRHAARLDAENLRRILEAGGYYAATVDADVIFDSTASGAQVTFTVKPSLPFVIEEYDIVYTDTFPGRPQTMQEAGIEPDGRADGTTLLALQNAFAGYLRDHGYPDAATDTRRVIADFDTGTGSAVFVFETGPPARMGETEFSGLVKTRQAYLRRLLPWKKGDRYDSSLLRAYREKLLATGLFTKAVLSTQPPDESGMVTVVANLKERRHRTIGGGPSYSSGEQFGGRLFFENRNMFGRGETVYLEGSATELAQSFDLEASRHVPRQKAALFTGLGFLNETTQAYHARTFDFEAGILKKSPDDSRLAARAALALETSRIDGNEKTYFFSLPVSAIWNTEDSILNPEQGFQAGLSVTPHTGSANFIQASLSGRGRFHVGQDRKFILAARSLLAGTAGTGAADLPENKRYYSGGSGSVRGFSYQEAGPLDEEGDPAGGLSVFELSVEARMKVSGKFQLALFTDAGIVSQNPFPDPDDEIFISSGAGVRYLSSIAPVRIDFALPVAGRRTGRSFQVYIALGQPF